MLLVYLGGFSCVVFAVSKYSCFLWEINETGCQSLSLCTKNRHCIWRNTLRITLITHSTFENEPGLLSNVWKGWSWSSCCITAPGSGVRSWARVNIRLEFSFNVLSVSIWVSSGFSGFLTHHKPITMSIMLLSTLQAPGPPQHWPGSMWQFVKHFSLMHNKRLFRMFMLHTPSYSIWKYVCFADS